MPRFAVIGNLVKDVIAGAPARPGGAVLYQARVFSEIEYAIDARLVTSRTTASFCSGRSSSSA